jgi:hypothetical protein
MIIHDCQSITEAVNTCNTRLSRQLNIMMMKQLSILQEESDELSNRISFI